MLAVTQLVSNSVVPASIFNFNFIFVLHLNEQERGLSNIRGMLSLDRALTSATSSFLLVSLKALSHGALPS